MTFPWGDNRRFNSYSNYFKKQFTRRAFVVRDKSRKKMDWKKIFRYKNLFLQARELYFNEIQRI